MSPLPTSPQCQARSLASHCSDQMDRRKRLALVLSVLAFFILGCTIVLAVLIQRLNTIMNNALDTSRTNHVVVCDIDRTVNHGNQIIACHDVPARPAAGK